MPLLPESVFLNKQDLVTHIYDEVLDIITRANDQIVNEGIHAAIGEAKTYLSRYDLVALFGVEDLNDATPAAPTFTDVNLRNMVKDIATWRVIRLSNPNIDIAMARSAYEDAVRWLKDVQKGGAPDAWPYKDTSVLDEPPEGDSVQAVSTEKRGSNYF